MRNHRFRPFFFILIAVFFSMNVLLPVWAASSQSWDLQTSSDYQFDANVIEVASGTASLKGRTDWLDSAWAYRKKTTINNATGTLTDFQVKVVLNSGNFDFAKANSNGSDIRITADDGVTPLPYWLEEYSAVDSAGIVWFKVASLPQGESDFYIYYGNANATSTANGKNVFPTFDDDFYDLQDPLYNAVTYLETPTYDGSGQAIHPDIYYNPNGWNGWEYWLANTPYPNNDETLENPSMLVSHDGLSWVVPDGLTNPIANKPVATSSYNSDPDLIYNPDEDYLMYYYREIGENSFDTLKLATSTNGADWSQPIALALANDDNAYSNISPSIVRLANGQYQLWYVGQGFGATGTRPIYYRTSSDGINWQDQQVTSWTGLDNSPWHINVRYLPSRQIYVMVISANQVGKNGAYTDLYLATSVDGLNWTTYSKKLLARSASGWDKTQLYRADFIYDEENNLFRLWYSARASSASDIWHTGYTSGNFDYILNDIRDQGQFRAIRSASTTAIAMGATVDTDGQYLHLAGASNNISSASILGQHTFTNNVVLELKQRINNKFYADVSFGSSVGAIRPERFPIPRPWHHTTIQNSYQWMWGGATNPIDSLSGNGAKIRRFIGNDNPSDVALATLSSTSSLNAWHKLRYIYSDSGAIRWYHDDNLWQSSTDTTFLNSDKRFLISQGEHSDGSGGDRYIDWIFVRQYASVDPTFSLGDEETRYSSLSPSIYPLTDGPDYNQLVDLDFDVSAGQIKIQISNDNGETFYWWNNNEWTEASDNSFQANDPAVVADHLTSFSSGQFSWRAYLISDGQQTVQLGPVTIQYINDTEVPIGSLTINAGASYTSTTSVSLGLSASDNIDATSSLSMQIANINDFSAVSWQSYADTISWTINGDLGVNSIYARFKDSAGNISEVVSASIIFDNQAPTGSLQINSGATKTSSTAANLQLTVTDNLDQLSELSFRIANDNEFTGVDWQSATSSLTWNLGNENGTKIVYVQWRDRAGNLSGAVTSSIELDNQAPSGSFQINNGAANLASTSVILNISVTDSDSLANLQMQVANSNDFNGVSWQPATTSLSWSLLSGSGLKTVYARFIDSFGNISLPSSASTNLDVDAPTGSLTINSGQTRTNQTEITLNISASDNRDSSDLLMMQVATSSNFINSQWQAYQQNLDNNLSDNNVSQTFYLRLKDSLGNISNTYSASIIFDNQPPTISQLTNQPNNNSVSISWLTNETIATTTINYGVSDQYGLQQVEMINNSEPQLTLSNLLSCSIYYYQLTGIDLAGNNSLLATSSFTTNGCLGDSSIEDQDDLTIDPDGGQLIIGDNDQGILLNFPNNFNTTSVVVQVQALEQTAASHSAGSPSGYQGWSGDWYQVNILNNNSQLVGQLDQPITVTVNYTLSQVVNLQTSTLALFRYHDGTWEQLDNCQNDFAALQITCTTNQFSAIVLMGRPVSGGQDEEPAVTSGSSLPLEATIKPVIKSDYFNLSKGQFIKGVWQVVEPIIKLRLSAPSTVSGLALSREVSFTSTNWQKYQSEIDWSICPTGSCSAGLYSLYARLYNAYGLASDSYKITINYQPVKSIVLPIIVRDLAKEKATLALFAKKYGHLPKSSTDWQSFQIMVYGTNNKPVIKPVKRDLNKEKIALTWFVKNYGRLPKTAADWQRINIRAYSS